MAFDSTIRIRQMNQAELSGFITPIVQAYLAGTGALSGIFYPRYSNPSGYLVSGAFISQTDLDSAITQALVYVSNTYYPNSNPSGFSTGISSGSLIPTGQLTGVFYPLNDNPSGYVTTGETGNFGGLNSVFITGNQDISGTKTFNNTGNFIQDLLLSGYPVVTGTNRIAPKTSGTYHYLGTDTFYGVAGMLQLGNANNNSGILMGFDGHGIPTIYGANLSNYQPDSPLSIYASSLIIGSRIDCNNSGNFLSGVFWNNNPVVTGGPYYPLNNPSGFISSGQTGMFITTGQTGLFYPYNSNPLGYISYFQTGITQLISNGSILIMPGNDIITDAAGNPLLDAAGNYILQKTTGNLGVNQSNPQYTIDVDGSGNFSNGLYWNGNPVVTGGPYLPNSTGVVVISGNISTSLRMVSGAFSISTGNSIILVNTLASGNMGTFPNASGLAGVQFVVKDWKGNATGNNIIITGINNQTFDGSLSKTISLSYDVLTVVSDGQNWCII